MTLQVSDFTKLCIHFAKHCLSLSIGRLLFLALVIAGYTGINHTVQSYTAASDFDNKENSSSMLNVSVPYGFYTAASHAVASTVATQGKYHLLASNQEVCAAV